MLTVISVISYQMIGFDYNQFEPPVTTLSTGTDFTACECSAKISSVRTGTV